MLRIAYSMFDSNNNCQATLSEVKEAVRARGAHINDAKVEEFFRSADTDGKRAINSTINNKNKAMHLQTLKEFNPI